MSKAPAFQFYAADYLADEHVQVMTLEQEGAQFRAIREACATGNREFLQQFPFIGKYLPPVKRRSKIPMPLRLKILAAGRCAFCGSSQYLQVDHIFPVALGGTDGESNLQPLCRSCNVRKGASA